MNKYAVYGWITNEIYVEAGTLEVDLGIRAVYNIASQIFEYPEGIHIRRIK